jgi:Protein of unknown function (DUF3575)
MQFISKLFALLFTLSTISILAQPKNAIKIDIHSPVARTIQLSYERTVSEKFTLGLSGLYTNQTMIFSNAYISRTALTPEFRYYLGKSTAMNGLFLSTFLRYQHLEAIQIYYLYDGLTNTYFEDYSTKQLHTGGVGMALGFHKVFDKHISIDAHLGTIWNTGDQRVSSATPWIQEPNYVFRPYVGYFIKSGISVGYAF